MNSKTKFVLNEIRSKYKQVSLNTYRILFIGSSQTWGAGAMHKDETFVHTTEKRLNEFNGNNIDYECINAGISSFTSKELLDVYKKEWITLNPNLVIISLGINDMFFTRRAAFYRYLKEFVILNQERGIKTIFILEATSLEVGPSSLPLHSIMQTVAQEHKIPVINLQQYLLAKYDTGFLWWDSFHLTSFGHDLAGNFLADAISKIIAKDLN